MQIFSIIIIIFMWLSMSRNVWVHIRISHYLNADSILINLEFSLCRYENLNIPWHPIHREHKPKRNNVWCGQTRVPGYCLSLRRDRFLYTWSCHPNTWLEPLQLQPGSPTYVHHQYTYQSNHLHKYLYEKNTKQCWKTQIYCKHIEPKLNDREFMLLASLRMLRGGGGEGLGYKDFIKLRLAESKEKCLIIKCHGGIICVHGWQTCVLSVFICP